MSEILSKYLTLFRNKLIFVFRRYSVPKWVIFFLDNLAGFLSFILAYILRFNFVISEITLKHAIVQGLIALFIYASFSLIFQSYSGLIRHTTLTDITRVFAVNTSASALLLLLSFLSRIFKWGIIPTIPFSVILINYGIITVLMFFVRVSIKVLFRFATGSLRRTKNVLIYGAGELGFIIKRVIMSDPHNGYNVVGFLDDSKKLQRKKINDIPVYNPEILDKDFLLKNKIANLILAIKNISPLQKREIIKRSLDLGLEALEIPSVEKWLEGKPDVNKFQKVKLEDLLGREPNKPDKELINRELDGKTVLVTGAAGSIGAELSRQLLHFTPKKVIFLDQAETPLFQVENELAGSGNNIDKTFIIGDVTSYAKMDHIFREYKPDIVFHSAAYKHVPLMEENPHEAFKVNVTGTKMTSELAIKHNTGKFILLSTDKCTDPSCVMSISRVICERIVNSLSQQKENRTKFITIRFGNVLGSGGSVVPIFTKQIAKGGPLTVTHPEISRHFMTITEASELILESGCFGLGGEMYLFDMGEPVRIAAMADKMIKLSGLVPGEDIEIVYTGLRPGEKISEEGPGKNIMTIPTRNPKINKLQITLNDYPGLLSKIDNVLNSLYEYSKQEIIDIMSEMAGIEAIRDKI